VRDCKNNSTPRVTKGSGLKVDHGLTSRKERKKVGPTLTLTQFGRCVVVKDTMLIFNFKSGGKPTAVQLVLLILLKILIANHRSKFIVIVLCDPVLFD
jgi:hypothetical protein